MDQIYRLAETRRFDEYVGNQPVSMRWAVYFGLGLMVLLCGITSDINNYYIQF